MRIGVTGSSGLVGFNFCKEALKNNETLNILIRKDTEYLKQIDANIFYGDLNDKKVLDEFCEGCDVIVHSAAMISIGFDSYKEVYEVNYVGTKNLLDLIRFKQENVSKRPIFFHFSTDEVYGDIESGEHVETDLLHPSNPYSAAKAAADMLVLAWASTYGIEYVILRPTNNYGIGQYPEKLVPLSVKNLQRGLKIRLHMMERQ